MVKMVIKSLNDTYSPFTIYTPDPRNSKLNNTPHAIEIIISPRLLKLLMKIPITPAANQATAILDRYSATISFCFADNLFILKLYHGNCTKTRIQDSFAGVITKIKKSLKKASVGRYHH